MKPLQCSSFSYYNHIYAKLYILISTLKINDVRNKMYSLAVSTHLRHCAFFPMYWAENCFSAFYITQIKVGVIFFNHVINIYWHVLLFFFIWCIYNVIFFVGKTDTLRVWTGIGGDKLTFSSCLMTLQHRLKKNSSSVLYTSIYILSSSNNLIILLINNRTHIKLWIMSSYSIFASKEHRKTVWDGWLFSDFRNRSDIVT